MVVCDVLQYDIEIEVGLHIACEFEVCLNGSDETYHGITNLQ